jgi:hypothetical protein
MNQYTAARHLSNQFLHIVENDEALLPHLRSRLRVIWAGNNPRRGLQMMVNNLADPIYKG